MLDLAVQGREKGEETFGGGPNETETLYRPPSRDLSGDPDLGFERLCGPMSEYENDMIKLIKQIAEDIRWLRQRAEERRPDQKAG